MLSPLLKLGYIDANASLSDQELNTYIKTFKVPGANMPDKLIDDDRNHGRKVKNEKDKEPRLILPFRSKVNDKVIELTEFLEDAGFLPNASHDGFFGYVTQAAVRLFQEYVRTKDPDYSSETDDGQKRCYPDGLVGKGTRKHIARWKKAAHKADWASPPKGKKAKAAKKWRNRFIKTSDYLKVNPGPIQEARKRFKSKTDSLLPKDWKFPDDQPLLFGIRRRADENIGILKWNKKRKKNERRRPMDDLFVLLVNGHSFVFYGSTDPSVPESNEQEPYLINGQHLYQFSWHKVSTQYKTYRGFRPAKQGVIIIRDKKGDDALTLKNIEAGPQKKTAYDINIHWSGRGSSNFSAGCQVIAGSSYLNDAGTVKSCKAFAAYGYNDLGKVPGKSRKTKGAYNLLTDLILVYGRNTSWSLCPPLRYTLFSASELAAAGAVTKAELKAICKKLK